MPGFGFGPQSTLAPYGSGMSGTDADLGSGAATPAPAGWSPSAWAVFSHAMSGNGEMGTARQDLINQHLAQLFAQEDRSYQDKAIAEAPDAVTRFAIHHDPNAVSSQAAQHFGFHTVGGGDTAIDAGRDLGSAPKVSSPAETATAANGAVSAQAANVAAQAEAEKARQAGLMTPAQILHLDRTGQAALIAARKQPGGGVKPGAPKPTGRVF